MCLSKLQRRCGCLTFPSMAIQSEPAAFTASCRGVTTRKTDALTPPLCPAFCLFHSFVGSPQRYFIPMRAQNGAPASLQPCWQFAQGITVSQQRRCGKGRHMQIFHACKCVLDYNAELIKSGCGRYESLIISPWNFWHFLENSVEWTTQTRCFFHIARYEYGLSWANETLKGQMRSNQMRSSLLGERLSFVPSLLVKEPCEAHPPRDGGIG